MSRRLEIPGRALHEKGFERKINVVTLVNGQQRRVLALPLINRWSTGRFVPAPVYIGFPLFVRPKGHSSSRLRYPGKLEGWLPSGPTEMSTTRFAQGRPAPPSALGRADPTSPLCVRVLDSTSSSQGS